MATVYFRAVDNDCAIEVVVEVEEMFDENNEFDGGKITEEAERQARQFIPPAIPLILEGANS